MDMRYTYDIRTGLKRVKTNTKKLVLGTMALAFPVTIALSGGAALAVDGNPVNAGQCSGDLIINVTQKIRNDADSGFGGYWANDNYTRSIKVWQTAPNTFCAVTTYNGQFTTYAGISPEGTGKVGAGVTGTFNGGYTSTVFTGTLLSPPLKSTHGNIGTFDYACVLSVNNTVSTCPGYVDWTTFYFSSPPGFALATWGWQYTTCNNGSWINASTGSTGDITGNVSHKDKCHEDNDGDHGHQGDDGNHDKDKHDGPRE
jgi:hypothetical protein